MKKHLIGAALAAATLLSGTAALANPALANPYIGASAGQADYDVNTTGALSSDTKDTGFKLYGGWMFSQNFGVEASLFDLGKAQGAVALPGVGNVGVEAKARGLGVYGLAALPINDFSLFAKAGFAYTRAEARITGPVGGSDTESKFNPVFGVGASYAITKNIGARAEWERLRIEYPGSQKEDTDLISVGLTYSF